MHRLRFALDQNFPVLLPGVTDLLPEVDITPVHRVDPRLARLGDRELVLALHQLGWDGLVTNNYKMLWQPIEVAAIVKTKITMFAVRGLGDDPVRAAGAVLLDLPGALRKIRPKKPNVFLVGPRNPTPDDAWEYFCQAADRRRQRPEVLYEEVKVTNDELRQPVLGDEPAT